MQYALNVSLFSPLYPNKRVKRGYFISVLATAGVMHLTSAKRKSLRRNTGKGQLTARHPRGARLLYQCFPT